MKSPSISGRARPGVREISGEGDRKDAVEIRVPPISVPWRRSRVARSRKRRGRGLTYWMPVIARREGGKAGRLRVVNAYRHRRRGRKLLEAAVREALGGRIGSWKARLARVDACHLEIEAPDRSRVVVFIPNPEKQSLRTLAAHLRHACTPRGSMPSAEGRRVATVVLVWEP